MKYSAPQHISSEYALDARITRVYVPAGTVTQDQVFYDAEAVNTLDTVTMIHVQPFRRVIVQGGPDPVEIVPAVVGDHCRMAMCQGQWRLTDVPESYPTDPCDETPGF